MTPLQSLLLALGASLTLASLHVVTSSLQKGAADLFTSVAEHDEQVLQLCSIIKAHPNTKLSIRRSPSESHCARPHAYKLNTLSLDVSRFVKILGVDPVISKKDIPAGLQHLWRGDSSSSDYGSITHTVDVQAMCSFERLVDALLPLGLIPAVVPEFKGITIGGSLQGLAAESTSFRYGLVHDCITGFECILGDGRRLWCSKDENAELFSSLPGSFGSLALCTRVKMLCLRAAPFVQVNVRHFGSASACVDYLQSVQVSETASAGAMIGSNRMDVLEGIGYSDSSFASIEGRFVADSSAASSLTANANAQANANDTASVASPASSITVDGQQRRVSRCCVWGHKWFYNQVRDVLPKRGAEETKVEKGTSVELVFPTKDYLFRHDHGSFWMASYRIPQIVGRFMGQLLDNASMFQLANLLPWAFPKSQIVLQDFMLPFTNVRAFLQHLQSIVQVYPLWLLPMRNFQGKGAAGKDGSKAAVHASVTGPIFGAPASGDMLNVGVYGIPRARYSFEADNRKMETLLAEQGGRKVYYSHSFYSREHFYGQMYDGQRYFELRDRLGAATLPEIFDKVVVRDGKL